MSVNVEYSTKEVSQVVLENVLKMLVRRNNISKHEKLLEELKESFVSKGVVDFKDEANQKISINLSNVKLSSIVQGSPLDDYLRNNLDVHKIVIMREPSKKVVKQIMTDYPNSEIFFEYEMMEDIPSKIFIPEHQLLTEEEKKNILETFKESELAKINDTDIMSRYYLAKFGDIFRIIRPSITAGKNIFYRRVVPGKIDQLFDN
jgi:DNA-directed RNA polymerase subunit H (RpoH/RPB5)